MTALLKAVNLGVSFSDTADVTTVLDRSVAIASAMHCPPTTATIRQNLKKIMEILLKNIYIDGVQSLAKAELVGKNGLLTSDLFRKN
jgi:hypothetical protein